VSIRRRKEISFCAWGVVGFGGFALFVLANFFDRDAEAPFMAGGGIAIILAAVALHALTCSLIDRHSPPD
jgi:hypothetical protein